MTKYHDPSKSGKVFDTKEEAIADEKTVAPPVAPPVVEPKKTTPVESKKTTPKVK